jgi:hypothetical protein
VRQRCRGCTAHRFALRFISEMTLLVTYFCQTLGGKDEQKAPAWLQKRDVMLMHITTDTACFSLAIVWSTNKLHRFCIREFIHRSLMSFGRKPRVSRNVEHRRLMSGQSVSVATSWLQRLRFAMVFLPRSYPVLLDWGQRRIKHESQVR